MKKTVIITGGSDGLGKEIARALMGEHEVVIMSQDEAKLKAAALELGTEYEVCDVSKYDDCAKAVQNVIAKHGAIDCLVNNAGIWIEGPVEENDPKRMREVLDVNVLGALYLIKEVVPHMKKAGQGTILNIVSQGGIYAKANRSVYTASKFAMNGFTKALELELAPSNIAVAGIYPGKLDTNLFKNAGVEGKDMSDALDPRAVAETVRFVLSFDSPVQFTEIGIKHINQ